MRFLVELFMVKGIIMKRLIYFLSSSLIMIYTFSNLMANTLDDIKESIKKAKDGITAAHLVCFMEWNNFDSKYDNREYIDEETQRIRELNKNWIIESDTIIDCRMQMVKSEWTDLRDINALAKENNLSPLSKRSLSSTRITFVKDNYEMVYFPAGDEEPNNANLILQKRPGPIKYLLDMPYYGIIDINFLDDKNNPTVSEVSVDGKSLIQINLSIEIPGWDGNKPAVVIQCDPQIEYRFRHLIRTDTKGKTSIEVIANEYMDANGIPYPSFYQYRQFIDGELYREEIYNFEKVQFGMDLKDSDFKMFLPEGTDLLDLAISKTAGVLGPARLFGIEDALAIGRNRLQSK